MSHPSNAPSNSPTDADLEDLLRVGLREAVDRVDAAYLPLEVSEIVAEGARTLSRRRRWQVLGAAAAAAVAVVGSWALTGGSGTRLSQQPATVPVSTVAPTTSEEIFVQDERFGVRVESGEVSTALNVIGSVTPAVLQWGPPPGSAGAHEVLVLIPEADHPDPGSVDVALVPDVRRLGEARQIIVNGRLVIVVRHTPPPTGMTPYAGLTYTIGGREVRHLSPGIVHIDGVGAGAARNEGGDFGYAVRLEAGTVAVSLQRRVGDLDLGGGVFTLPAGSPGLLRLGDGADFDMAYALVRGIPPRAVTVTGDTPSRFAGGVSWGGMTIDDTDVTLVLIALTGTDDSGSGQLRSITWTDADGGRHTIAAS